MTPRRKPGKNGKKPSAPRKQAAPPARAPAKRVSGKNAATKASAVRASARASASRGSSARTSAAADAATLVEQSSPALAPFPAECTIAQASDLKDQLARVLDAPNAITLDLTAVRRVDTAALQLFIVFIRERRAAGRDVECQGASDAFLATAEVLGLRALFQPVSDERLMAPAAGNA